MCARKNVFQHMHVTANKLSNVHTFNFYNGCDDQQRNMFQQVGVQARQFRLFRQVKVLILSPLYIFCFILNMSSLFNELSSKANK